MTWNTIRDFIGMHIVDFGVKLMSTNLRAAFTAALATGVAKETSK